MKGREAFSSLSRPICFGFGCPAHTLSYGINPCILLHRAITQAIGKVSPLRGCMPSKRSFLPRFQTTDQFSSLLWCKHFAVLASRCIPAQATDFVGDALMHRAELAQVASETCLTAWLASGLRNRPKVNSSGSSGWTLGLGQNESTPLSDMKYDSPGRRRI